AGIKGHPLFNGWATFNRVSGVYRDNSVSITDTWGRLFFQDSNLVIHDCRGFMNNNNFLMQGDICNLFNPDFDIQVLFSSFDPSGLLKPGLKYAENLEIAGPVQLKAKLKSGIKGLEVFGTANAKKLVINKFQIDDFNSEWRLDRGRIAVRNISGKLLEGALSAQGEMNFAENKEKGYYNFNVQLDDLNVHKMGVLYPELNLLDGHINSVISIKRYEDKNIRATCNWSCPNLKFKNFVVGKVEGLLNLEQENFQFSINAPGIKSNFKGDIKEVFLKPVFNFNFNTSNWILHGNECITAVNVKGPLNKFKINGMLSAKKGWLRGKTDITGEGVKNKGEYPELKFLLRSNQVFIRGVQDVLYLACEFKNGIFRISDFQFGNKVRGFAGIYLKNDYALMGKIDFIDFQPGDILTMAKFPERVHFPVHGKMKSVFSFGGYVNNPAVFINMDLKNGVIGDQSGLSTNFNVIYKDKRLLIDSLHLRDKDSKLINIENLCISKDEMAGSITCNGISMSVLSQIFLKKSNFSSGTISLNLKMDGNLNNRKSRLSFNMANLGYGFYHLDSIKGKIIENKHRLEIETLEVNTRHLSCNVTGTLPLSIIFDPSRDRNEDSIRLEIFNLQGDIGKELSQVIQADYKNPNKNKTLVNFLRPGTTIPINGRLQVLGSVSNIYLRSGYINIIPRRDMDGKNKIICGRLFDKGIDDLQGKIIIDEGYAEIELNGMVKDRALKIINQKNKHPLKQLYIGQAGLNLGILNVITDKRGIETSIPRFMYPNEFGFVILSGREKGERFTISGPFESPLFSGKMTLNDLKFTFPFLDEESDNIKKENIEIPKVRFDMNLNTRKGLMYCLFRSGPQINQAITQIGEGRYAKAIKQILNNLRSEITFKISSIEISKRSWLHLSGSPMKGDFKLEGQITSNQGIIEYIFREYEIFHDDVKLNFIPELVQVGSKQQYNNAPLIRGRACLRDDIGCRKEIRLYHFDENTGKMSLYKRMSDHWIILPKEVGEGKEGHEADILKEQVDSLRRRFGFDKSVKEGMTNLVKLYSLRMGTDYLNTIILNPLGRFVLKRARIGRLGIDRIGLKINENRLQLISNELLRQQSESLTPQQLLSITELRAQMDLPWGFNLNVSGAFNDDSVFYGGARGSSYFKKNVGMGLNLNYLRLNVDYNIDSYYEAAPWNRIEIDGKIVVPFKNPFEKSKNITK
ncbi:MAG: hypothetical protein ABIA63_00145, partial [bacterium]